MSKAVNSPTARLLQSSRLFSLPRPLPSPDLSSAISGTFRSSDTATTPYPTHQAIVTTASSRHRGDWGLKRSLPNKRLRGTNPTVRIRAQDTWEHVTSFESAGDHVRTLQKWDEMGVPMIVKKQVKGGTGPGGYAAQQKPISVYDEAHDTTDRQAADERRGEGRWKYEGPWLSGMQEGEFKNWLLRQVRSRQGEWQEFLRQQETERRVREALSNARSEGNPLSGDDLENIRTDSRPTDDELELLFKDLRDDHAEDRLSSELTALITRFLDLPAVPGEERSKEDDEFRRMVSKLAPGLSTEKGPPSTHPGAGLSHIRTSAVMENHPIHGPQASRTPVQARVVLPRTSGGRATERLAKVGVGGVIAEDSASGTRDASRFKKDADDPAHMMNPETEGGGKIWVQPNSASVDEKGRIQLTLGRADLEALAVKTGDVEAIHEQKRQGALAAGPAPARGTEYNARYGTSLPDTRRFTEQGRQQSQWYGGVGGGAQRPRPGVRGFDEELRGQGQANSVADLLRRGL